MKTYIGKVEKEVNGETNYIYPVTSAKAVLVDKGGVTLQDKLDSAKDRVVKAQKRLNDLKKNLDALKNNQ